MGPNEAGGRNEPPFSGVAAQGAAGGIPLALAAPPPSPKAQRTALPEMGALPRDWKWGEDFLPTLLKWLQELQWLTTDDTLL